MKTQPVPGLNRNTTTGESLKSPPLPTFTKSRFFEVLYDFLLFAAIPIAFEMSYIKIAQVSINAYSGNDVMAISRLIVYLAVQWLLGVMVRNNYATVTLKRVTLVLMIMLQLKDAFFEEVLVDMMISMILESGLALLLFFKFAQLMVILKFMGLMILVTGVLPFVTKYPYTQTLQALKQLLGTNLISYYMHRIYNHMYNYMWQQNSCCRIYTHS